MTSLWLLVGLILRAQCTQHEVKRPSKISKKVNPCNSRWLAYWLSKNTCPPSLWRNPPSTSQLSYRKAV